MGEPSSSCLVNNRERMSSRRVLPASVTDYLARTGRIACCVGLLCLVLGIVLIALGDALSPQIRWPLGVMLTIVGLVLTLGPLKRLWRGIDNATTRALQPYGTPQEVLRELDREWSDRTTIQTWQCEACGPRLVLTKNWLVKLHAGTLEVMPLGEIQWIEKRTLPIASASHRGDEFDVLVLRDTNSRELIVEWSRDSRDEIIAAISKARGRGSTPLRL
jgi:hypothetical protein